MTVFSVGVLLRPGPRTIGEQPNTLTVQPFNALCPFNIIGHSILFIPSFTNTPRFLHTILAYSYDMCKISYKTYRHIYCFSLPGGIGGKEGRASNDFYCKKPCQNVNLRTQIINIVTIVRCLIRFG